jgi:hypothetical protein
MAKKTVATLQKGSGKGYSKVVRMVKSEKSGSYTFKESIIANEEVANYFKK